MNASTSAPAPITKAVKRNGDNYGSHHSEPLCIVGWGVVVLSFRFVVYWGFGGFFVFSKFLSHTRTPTDYIYIYIYIYIYLVKVANLAVECSMPYKQNVV